MVFSCFIGFDFAEYKKIKTLSPEEVKSYFEQKYRDYAKQICEIIQKEIQVKNITDFNIQFFLLPFPSVKDFRKSFYDKIGMPNDFE